MSYLIGLSIIITIILVANMFFAGNTGDFEGKEILLKSLNYACSACLVIIAFGLVMLASTQVAVDSALNSVDQQTTIERESE